MTVQSDDGRLTVQRYTNSTVMMVGANGLLSEQQVYDALLPLLPPPAPTAREVAEAASAWAELNPGRWDKDRADVLYHLARRWDEGGRP